MIGRIISIDIYSVVQQIPIIIPGVIDSIHTRQTVGIVGHVVDRGRETTDHSDLLEAIPYRVVGVVIVIIVGIVGLLQPVERIVNIVNERLAEVNEIINLYFLFQVVKITSTLSKPNGSNCST